MNENKKIEQPPKERTFSRFGVERIVSRDVSDDNYIGRIANNLYGLVYEDDGPMGICGQSCSITCPWKKLYLFENEEAMRLFMKRTENNRNVGRRNARITHVFNPYPLADDVNFIAG